MLTAAAAHDGDVNVISWSRREPFLLSGGDDGALKVWDLRQFKVLSQPDISPAGGGAYSQQLLGFAGFPWVLVFQSWEGLLGVVWPCWGADAEAGLAGGML